MRVLIDARMLLGRFSGVARFATSLVNHLSIRGDIQPVALCGDEIPSIWQGNSYVECIRTDFSLADRTPPRRRRWERRNVARIIHDCRADVFHATWNSGIPAGLDIPSVLTIHDLIPLHERPRPIAAWLGLDAHRRAVRASIRRASVITTVSDFVRRDVMRWFRVAPERIVTVLNGVEPAGPSRFPQDCSNRPFFLYVGGHEPRKNVAGLLAAFGRYLHETGDDIDLCITGQHSSLCSAANAAFAKLKAVERVLFLGQPNEEELDSLYRRAAGLLLLSWDEGFGLPPLEAMTRGCPVIVSNRGALPEVVDKAGIIVNPADIGDAVSAMLRLRRDADARTQLSKRGHERAASLTWSKTAARFAELYGLLLAQNEAPREKTAILLADANRQRYPAESPVPTG